MNQRHLLLLEPELEVDLATQSAEWEHHLRRAIAEEMGSTGLSARTVEATTDVPVRHMEFTPKSESVSGSLLLLPTRNGLAPFVATTEPLAVSELGLWEEVVRRATRDLGNVISAFEWSAVIDCTLPHHQVQELRHGADVGPLRIDRIGVVREQHVPPTRPPSISTATRHWSFPLRVTGVSEGYDWESASRGSGRALHTLLCLLGVAWDYPWQVVDAPRPIELGLPDVPPWPWWCRESDADRDTDTTTLGRAVVELPEWGSDAWNRLTTDPAVGNAASAFREGLLLQDGHESFALVAYVAAIEGVGQILNKPARCRECGNVVEATSRFRQAASLVATPEDEPIIKRLVDHRGETAHQGCLHGLEVLTGQWPSPSLLQVDPEQLFERDLYSTRRMARSLLRRMLASGDLRVGNTV